MGRKTDLNIGSINGKLKIIAVKKGLGAGKHAIAVCLCECGKEHEIKSHLFKKMKSCGCSQHDSENWISKGAKNKPWQLPYGESALNALLYSYKRGAERRNLTFDLSREEFKKLVNSNCFYCGVEPNRIFSNRGNGSIVCNGIDRYLNEDGYTKENSVSCCKECNLSKNKRTAIDFLNHIQRIHDFQKRKEEENDDQGV